jgi:serine/threonine-protein kinase
VSANQPTPKDVRPPGAPPVRKARPDPLQGRIVLDRYRITARIARGGMGAVYLGRNVEDGTSVAIKVLHEDLASDDAVRLRFLNESRAAQRIDHSAVVRVLDVGEVDGSRICLVMEYVDGTPLRRVMRDGPLPQGRVALIAAATAEGLAAAHEKGVIHRDLKPENVLLPRRSGSDTLVKLVDFGIARMIDTPSITTTQHVMGTPQYISPEQAEGAPIDPRADIYSLGVMMYEMLTGELPFLHDDVHELLHAHIERLPTPLREWGARPMVDPALEDLVMRCLSKPPDLRPPDMNAVVEALSNL